MVLLLAVFFPVASSEAQVMRESDQASLVDGVLQLKEGQPKRGADFYNYDKQYLSYWLCVPPKEMPDAMPEQAANRLVGWVNLVSGSVGLIGFWLVWWTCVRRPSVGRVLSAVAFTSCPIVLLSAAPASSATISGGFLLALVALLSLHGKWIVRLQMVFVPLLVFAAVAARADAVLCLPMLCWASHRGRDWRHFRTRPLFWVMAMAALAALIVGRWLISGADGPGASTTFYGFFFVPKVFAAYLVFGLGGCGLWWLVQMIAGLAASKHRFYQFGVLLLLLPLLFYCWQLFSPRHLMTTVMVTLAGGFLWKGRLLFRFWRSRWPRSTRVVVVAVLVTALLPLVVGIYLPFSGSPRPVVARSTEFPTSDGLWPMGATLSFLARMRHSEDQPIDHNQALWQAAIRSDFSGCGSEGTVAILESDMRAYLELAVRLHGRKPKVVTWEELLKNDSMPCVFVDERALRIGSGAAMGDGERRASLEQLQRAGFSIEVVSLAKETQAILRLKRGQEGESVKPVDTGLAERMAVAEIFGGDEFVDAGLVPVGDQGPLWRASDRDGGKTVVFASSEHFTADGGESSEVGGLRLVRFSGGESEAKNNRVVFAAISEQPKIRVWIGVLPDYMSREKLVEERAE
jgi:hypothetical protein